MDAERKAPSVLLVRGSSAALVEQACAEAGVCFAPLEDGDAIASSTSLVIAELRAGDRRVPKRALEAVSQSGGRARLLLLCADPLVRPHVSTQGGRVIMVGPPHSSGRLANRIRVLTTDGGERPGLGPLERRERLTDRFWLCAFQSKAAGAGIALEVAEGGGFTAVLPPPGGEAKQELLQRVVELLARERSDEARIRELPDLAAPCAAVHLSPAVDRWLFGWPSAAWPLWIHSPQRLPPHADVAARSAHQRAWSMIAAPGDLLLVSTAPLDESGPVRAAFRLAVEEGGPSAVDRIGAGSSEAGTSLCGLAVEVHG